VSGRSEVIASAMVRISALSACLKLEAVKVHEDRGCSSKGITGRLNYFG
jgi:hypothetical protein